MVSPANNPNRGNQKGGKENSNAADEPKRKDEASGDRQSQEAQEEQDRQINKRKGQVGSGHHGG